MFDTSDKDHVSLLLFLECRAVDNYGSVDIRHMNADDMTLVAQWTKEGFVKYGRICSNDIRSGSYTSAWVFLSDEAFAKAAEVRRARALRMWGKRGFRTTTEYRGEEIASTEPS